jgi:2',3'-cyclic-nucleotide 2'-phosphodiesterase (5'-nucleotidase family)
MGGLSRKYTAVRSIKDSENIDHLLIDSGNLLFSTPKKSAINSRVMATAKTIANIYHEMNYDAVNIGLNDLAAGIRFLKKLEFLPWVSANLYDNSGKNIFKPYILKPDGKLKYAIVGLSPPPFDTSSELSYRSWRIVLAPLVSELKQKVDCIILLSSLDANENREIIKEFPDIHLLFSALSMAGNMPPQIINKSLTTQTADRGRYLGQLYLTNPGIYDWADLSATGTNVAKQSKSIEYRLSRIEYLIRQNNSHQDTLATLEKQKTTIIKQLEGLDKNKSEDIFHPQSTFKASFTPLTKNIVESRKINKMINELKKEVDSMNN